LSDGYHSNCTGTPTQITSLTKKYGVRTGAQTRQRNWSPLQTLICTTESDK